MKPPGLQYVNISYYKVVSSVNSSTSHDMTTSNQTWLSSTCNPLPSDVCLALVFLSFSKYNSRTVSILKFKTIPRRAANLRPAQQPLIVQYRNRVVYSRPDQSPPAVHQGAHLCHREQNLNCCCRTYNAQTHTNRGCQFRDYTNLPKQISDFS